MLIAPLDLVHQNRLEEKFRKLNLFLSEYSFANLYLFRSIHHYEAIQIEDEIFIRGLTRDKTTFLMLTLHPEAISDALLLRILPLAESLFPLQDHWMNLLKIKMEKLGFLIAEKSLKVRLDNHEKSGTKSNTCNIYYREDESDYIYRRNTLATYPGRRMHSKRNLVKQLLAHHKVVSQSINQQINECEDIVKDWQKGQHLKPEETDYFPCLEGLKNLNRLQLKGTLVYVDDQPSGFTLGEQISKNCYAIHFLKASSKIRGLHQFLLEESARTLEYAGEWINLEQDLGIAGLKESKLSYHPEFVMKKWRIQLSLKNL